ASGLSSPSQPYPIVPVTTLPTTPKASEPSAVLSSTPIQPSSPSAVADTFPKSSPPVSDPIAELTKQFSQLALLIKANMEGPKPVMTAPNAIPNAPPAHTPLCIFCDSTEHTRRTQCPDFAEALRKGLVYLNAQNRIVNAVTGQEIPPMFGKGGMKKLLENPPAVVVQNNNITLDNLAHLGNKNSVHVTYIDFDTDTQRDEIIDVEVYEKRRREDILRRRVRPRVDDVRPAPPNGPSDAQRPDAESPQQSSQCSETPGAAIPSSDRV